MTISAFDLFKVGIGPSSSHTVAPMRAARSFAARLEQEGLLASTTRVRAELFGSLGATGHGHGSVGAVALGLEGEQPDVVDPAAGQARVLAIRDEDALLLMGKQRITFRIDDDIVLHRRKRLPLHPNGMLFRAAGVDGSALLTRTYYSVGGGFVLSQDEAGNPALAEDPTPVRYPFRTGAELLARTRETGLSISEIMLANELAWRSAEQVHSGLLHIWSVKCGAARTPPECCREGSRCAAVPRRSGRAWRRTATPATRCARWNGSPSTPWRSTRRTRQEAAWLPRFSGDPNPFRSARLNRLSEFRQRRFCLPFTMADCDPAWSALFLRCRFFWRTAVRDILAQLSAHNVQF